MGIDTGALALLCSRSEQVSRRVASLVGLVLSANQGKRLRRLHQRHGKVTLRLRVDVRKYVGTHDVVSDPFIYSPFSLGCYYL